MPTSNKIGWLLASSFGAAIALSGFILTNNSQLQASTVFLQEEDEGAEDQEESKTDGSGSADKGDDANSEKKKDDEPKKKKKPKKGPEGTNVGETIKTISGKDVDGEKFSLDDYEGKVVMLDFWGDW